MDRRDHVAGMIAAFNDRRFEDYAAGFDEAAVLEFPQSGELIRGSRTIGAMYGAAPSLPSIVVVSISELAGLVVVDIRPDYGDGQAWTGVLLFEFSGDRVVRQRAYFGAPFDPPPWRIPYLDG